MGENVVGSLVALKGTKVHESDNLFLITRLYFFSKSLEKTYDRRLLHRFAGYPDTFQDHFEKSLIVFADGIICGGL